MMLHLAIQVAVFIVACALAWYPGNRLTWLLWERFAKYAHVPIGTPFQLARTIGGLERILYIFGVMAEKYELLAGWLVMKAFFGWIEESKSDIGSLVRYYGFLQGNLTSLLIGLFVGEGAKLFSDWMICWLGY
jgi:hypothetical protein